MKPCQRCIRWTRTHLGRRGAALLFFAILDLTFAWSLLDPQATVLVRMAPLYRVVVQTAPLWVWGLAWGVVGLLCAIQAWRRRDAVAFAAVIMLKITWGGAIAAAGLLYGAPRAWISATIYFSLAAFVGVISGWPEPLDQPPEDRHE